ncbi:MAG: glycosyltransferase family 2 protein [Caldilineaceae bacterium]|nr:glycosyltransferase family 2 protein [Caldilineaceae bacterium]
MEKPLASIIIVTYNAMPYIDNCLTAVLREAQAQHEIIVIDNASTDGTGPYIQQQFPAVRLVCNRMNIGFAPACNQGARLAQGRYFVFLNQDTIVYPAWLGQLLRPLQNEKGVALSTSKLLLMSQPEQINACGLDVHFSGLSFMRGILGDANAHNEAVAVCAVHGASFAVDGAVWHELGGFDETLFMYYEETDFSWRAQLAGYKCVYAPTSVTLHDYKLAQASANAFYYSKRNRYILLLKTWRWSTLFLLLPGLVLAEVLDWGHALLIGKVGMAAKVKSYLWLAANLRKILALRGDAQRQRRVGDGALLQHCTGKLAAVEFQGGLVGNILTKWASLFLQQNHRIAHKICTSLHM